MFKRTATARSGFADRPLFVGLIFFVSGFPALIYQLTWQRSLFTIFGINVEAVTVVVAGFLLGLGVGSLAGGRLSLRFGGSLLALFGAIELAIGAFGVLSLRLFEMVGAQTLYLPLPGTAGVVLALLFVPTLLMGSTLPILTAYRVSRSRHVGRSVGLLYCVNTLGSAIACFACAFGLMRLNGMQGQVNLAASINILIGLTALTVAYRSRADTSRPVAESAPSASLEAPVFGLVATMILAAIIGYISLSYEILWFRAFALANNTAGAFAIVLGCYLAGIANGSLRAERLFARAWNIRRGTRLIALYLFAAAILGFFLLPITTASSYSGLGYFYPMTILIFMQASLFGGLFPVLCHSSIAADAAAGARLSQIYLASILGSVAGTLVTGFVLMDNLSLATIAVWLAACGIAVAAAIAALAASGPAARVVLIAGGLVAIPVLDRVAPALFGHVYEALTYKAAPQPGQDFTETVENKSGVITVGANGTVFGGGAYDGMIEIDMLDDPNLLVRPFSLSLYHPAPKSVLMIGLATGAWGQVLANHPALEHLTIVEINPGYLPIIARHPAVAGLLRNPKVEIVIDDGRRWLNRHPAATFDVIVQNTTWNYRPNVTNLLSAEYLRLLRAHLRPGGIALYNTTGSLRAQRTACNVFPSAMREINVMVGSNQKLTIDHERWRTVFGGYHIDGHPVFEVSDTRYRARLDELVAALDPARQPPEGKDALLESCASIVARTAGLAPITDDNMGEEWGFIQPDPLLERIHNALGF